MPQFKYVYVVWRSADQNPHCLQHPKQRTTQGHHLSWFPLDQRRAISVAPTPERRAKIQTSCKMAVALIRTLGSVWCCTFSFNFLLQLFFHIYSSFLFASFGPEYPFPLYFWHAVLEKEIFPKFTDAIIFSFNRTADQMM